MSQQSVGSLNVKVSASTDELAGDIKRAQSMLGSFATSMGKILGKGTGLGSSLQKEAASALGMLNGFARSASGALGSIAKAVNPFSGMMPSFEQLKTIGIGGLAGLTAMSVKLAADAEQTEIAYKTLIGTTGDYKATLKEIKEFAAVTPFGSTELLTAGKQLLAYGTSAEQLLPTIATLGDAAAATNTPMTDLVYLFGTLRTQGRAYTVDIKQFANRGIPIWDELAKTMKVNVSQMHKLVEEGRVGFPEVVRAFKSMSSEGGRFYQMMEAQSKTLAGLFEGLKDNVVLTMADIGQTIVDAFDLKSLIKDATDFTKKIRDQTHIIKPYIQEIANYIKGMTSNITLKDVLDGGKEIVSWAAAAANAIYTIGRSILAFAQGVATSLAPVGAALGSTKDWLASWTPNIEGAKLAGVDFVEYIVAGFEHIENAFTSAGAMLKRGLIAPMLEMQAVMTELGQAMKGIPLLGGGPDPISPNQQALQDLDKEISKWTSYQNMKKNASLAKGKGSSDEGRADAASEVARAEKSLAGLMNQRKALAAAVMKEAPSSLAGEVRKQAAAIKAEADASQNWLENGAKTAKAARRTWFDVIRASIKATSAMKPVVKAKVDADTDPARKKIRALITDFGLPQWLKDKDMDLIKKWTSDVVKFKKEMNDLTTLNTERFWENLQKNTPTGQEIESIFKPYFDQFAALQGVADAPGLLDQYNDLLDKLQRPSRLRGDIADGLSMLPGGKQAVEAFGNDFKRMLKSLPPLELPDMNPLKETISSLKWFDPKMIREQFLPILEGLPGLKIPVKFIKDKMSDLLPFDRTYALELADQFRGIAKNIPQLQLPSAAIKGTSEAVSAVNQFQMGQKSTVEDVLLQIRSLEEQQLQVALRLTAEIRATSERRPDLFVMPPR